MKRASFALLFALVLPSHRASAAPVGSGASHAFLEVEGVATGIRRIEGLGMGGSRPHAVDLWVTPARGSAMFNWVAAAFKGTAAAKTTTFLWTDYSYAIQEATTLDTARIVEVEVPGADSGDTKTNTGLRVRLQPDKLAFPDRAGRPAGAEIEQWIVPALFRLHVDGIESSKVVKVAPFVVRPESGGTAPFELRVTIENRLGIEDWKKWAHDELVDGSAQRVRTGKLQYFEKSKFPAGAPFLVVDLFEMRMKSFEHLKWRAGGATPTITFVLDVERARLRTPVTDRKTKLKPPKGDKLPVPKLPAKPIPIPIPK